MDDFLQLGAGSGDGKSTAGIRGAPDRDALLCSVMAKVELQRPQRFALLLAISTVDACFSSDRYIEA